MRFSKIFCLSSVAALAACGGGGGGSSTPSSSTPSSTTTYNFVPPTLNASAVYALTTVDNSNNTINQVFDTQVTIVNSDGSFVEHVEDPTHNAITANGTSYAVPTQDINVNNVGFEISYTSTPPNGVTTSCTYTPHGSGPNHPFAVGDSWSSSWNLICGSAAPVAYSQTGTVMDTETITVPAGTFSAIKLQSTISWTDLNGTTHTDARTTWKDVNGSHLKIKEVDTYSYSGTTPAHGYPVQRTSVLQSHS